MTALHARQLATLAHPTKFPVPLSRAERDRIRDAAERFVAKQELIPPLSIEELRGHARDLCRSLGFDDRHSDWIMVLLNNAVWRGTVAAVPYERRVLLLPQCLRNREHCRAELDEVGLLCEECGSCSLGELQSVAENLGYVVLIAEGTTVVTKLLESGKVDAVVGVSCMGVLERAFPYMAADAIPGLAIPLARDGCEDTEADLDWVWDAIHLRSAGRWLGQLDLDNLRDEVRSWFGADELRAVLTAEGTETEEIALSWVAKSGKRWRPILAACVFRALNGLEGDLPESVRKVALAVECFHKASLVHDDIADGDDTRYGGPTLHVQHDVPIALNAGDLLLGEGYRLLGACALPADRRAALFTVAADGHRALCLGQGEELCWTREPSPLSSQQVLRIFRLKTAPAFEVALRLGALCAGAGDDVCQVLILYSQSLGIAYQIRDDLHDFLTGESGGDALSTRPSLLLALAHEMAEGSTRERLAERWRRGPRSLSFPDDLRAIVERLRVEEKARQLLEHHKNEAVRSLSPLRNAHLKGLLRRIIGRILDD